MKSLASFTWKRVDKGLWQANIEHNSSENRLGTLENSGTDLKIEPTTNPNWKNMKHAKKR